MRTNIGKTAQLGELVVAAFDKAALDSTNPVEVSRLATRAIMHILRRARRPSPPPSPPRCDDSSKAQRGAVTPDAGGKATNGMLAS